MLNRIKRAYEFWARIRHLDALDMEIRTPWNTAHYDFGKVKNVGKKYSDIMHFEDFRKNLSPEEKEKLREMHYSGGFPTAAYHSDNQCHYLFYEEGPSPEDTMYDRGRAEIRLVENYGQLNRFNGRLLGEGVEIDSRDLDGETLHSLGGIHSLAVHGMEHKLVTGEILGFNVDSFKKAFDIYVRKTL